MSNALNGKTGNHIIADFGGNQTQHKRLSIDYEAGHNAVLFEKPDKLEVYPTLNQHAVF